MWRTDAGVYGGQNLCVAWLSEHSGLIDGTAECKVKWNSVWEANRLDFLRVLTDILICSVLDMMRWECFSLFWSARTPWRMACFRCAVETPPLKRPYTSLRAETTSSDTFLLPTIFDFGLFEGHSCCTWILLLLRECRGMANSFFIFPYISMSLLKFNLVLNKDELFFS